MLVLFPGTLAAQTPDCTAAVTQQDMNQCAGSSLDQADAELNQTYAQALDKARYMDANAKAGAEDALRTAQRAWISFRDAACTLEALPFEGGSIQSMIYSGCMDRLTRARTEDLTIFIGQF